MVRACLTAPPRACKVPAYRVSCLIPAAQVAALPKLVGSGTSETEAD